MHRISLNEGWVFGRGKGRIHAFENRGTEKVEVWNQGFLISAPERAAHGRPAGAAGGEKPV